MNFEEVLEDPIDCIEWMAVEADWLYERLGRDEALVTIPLDSATYEVSVSWSADFQALLMSCNFPLAFSDGRREMMRSVAARINEHLVVGHFDVWPGEQIVRHRQSLLINGVCLLSGEQLEAMIQASLSTCERYFSAFQMAAHSRQSASEIFRMTLMPKMGHA